MATFTVNDILGVGFKYEQTAEDQIAPTPTGTSAAIFGTATWGPIGTPTYINGGLKDFKNRFGYAGTTADDGWDSASYHFKWSSLGYFTRIASSVNPANRSYKEVVNNATNAFLVGDNVLSSLLRIYPAAYDSPNNVFSFLVRHKNSSMSAYENITSTINFETEELVSAGAIIRNDYSSSGTLTAGDNITFSVYNEDGSLVDEYSFTAAGGENITGASSFVSILLNPSQSIYTGNGTHFTLTSSGDTVTLTTEPYYYGENAKIEITNNDIGILGGTDTGADVSRTAVIDKINTNFKNLTSTANLGSTLETVYGSSLTFATINSDSNIVLTAPTTGNTSAITIPSTNSLFGFSAADTSFGVNSKTVGSFRATRRGSEGNLIRLVFSNTTTIEPRCDVYFRGTLISSIIGYNFNSTSNDFLGNIIKDSSALSSILEYNHAKTYSEFDEDDDSLSLGLSISNITSADIIGDGEYILTGGTNGETGINTTNDLLPQIRKMSNEDIYDFDLIVAPGYPEQGVQKVLIEDICDYRKDCFTLLDMPDFGNPSAAIDRAINWINGKHISRSEKLNSIYASVYFPYIKIRKQSYDSNMNTVSSLIDNSPISRVVGMISRCDYIAGNKFSAPAGVQRGGLQDVEGLKQTLSAEERDRLYADAYDNCINPIMYTINNGFFVNGQKTALRKNSSGNLTALSRINVMRVGLFIKKEVARVVPYYFHEPNDERSQKDFAAVLTGIMSSLVNLRAIEDNYIVRCDASTNPPEVTNNNGLIAQIEFTPIKTIERIKLIANIKEKKSSVTVA
jgi:hypothetical protein